MTPEEFLSTLEARILAALETQQRHHAGALARLANRLEQRARLQAQLFATLHFGKGQVPEEVTNQIAKIWLD
jgi:nitrate reductase assembly molybdenum cofactor insertion protein NarJ